MRMMMNVHIPHEPFNTYVREGKAEAVIEKILADAKPEAVYLTETRGARGAVMILNIDEASSIPALAEPWFLLFNADCEFRVVMLPADLQKAGLDELGEKWR